LDDLLSKWLVGLMIKYVMCLTLNFFTLSHKNYAKLMAHILSVCHCHQAVPFGTNQSAVTLYGKVTACL